MDDLTLSETGLPPAHSGRILLIACGALAHEILALKAANGWTHLDLQCLPAKLHLWPEKIIPAVEEAVSAARGAYETVFVVYADCGTGGLLKAACDHVLSGNPVLRRLQVHGAAPLLGLV